jgi:DNA polymerase III gamma/tau subunit
MDLKGTQWTISARPSTIDEVYGGRSSSIDTMLKPFVKQHAKHDKWPNGILLMGKSGGGKTTIAKIIAMTMVCKNPDKDGNPCCECSECKAILSEKFNQDVTLVNAATLKDDTGSSVDNMRRLVEKARAVPFFGGRRRVIIVDEVQEILRGTMKAAVNTLLKELERKDSRTCWIFTSMDNIKATGSTVETELGNGSGYGSSGSTGFLRRVTQFKFTPLTDSDIILYLVNFCKTHNYDGDQTLWKYLLTVLDESTKTFLTEGFKAIAEASVGSVGVALANLQLCIESKAFDTYSISKFIGLAPETEILQALNSIANNQKTDQAFTQIASIDNSNFATVYQIMMSGLRRAEMYRVFGKVGNMKLNKGTGREELKISTDGLVYNQAVSLASSPNYKKLKDVLLKLNQDGFFTVDYFRTMLLSIYD